MLVAISNFHLAQNDGPLVTWIDRVRKAGVGPWMVLAIDEQLHSYLTTKGVPSFLLKAEVAAAQAGTGSNHAVSALKFGLLAQFLQLGWSVLLSDVDIVVLRDPFPHLYRDRDIEGAAPHLLALQCHATRVALISFLQSVVPCSAGMQIALQCMVAFCAPRCSA